MELISTQQSSYENYRELFQFDTKLRRIWAVSAYYDEVSIRQLMQLLEEQGAGNSRLELIVILDRRVSNLIGLQELDQEIRNKFTHQDSGIYLCDEGELFHSKGYLAETGRDGICLLGSLNLTQKGLTRNEEILVSARYVLGSRSKEHQLAEAFEGYVNEVWDRLTRIGERRADKDKGAPKSLVDCFLNGVIYYETRESSPFGFPLNLPEVFLETDSPINDVLESKTSDVVNLFRLLERVCMESMPSRPKGKSQWKRHCLQTCYGFWSPVELKSDIEEALHNKSQLNEYYKNIALLLRSNTCALEDEVLSLSHQIFLQLKEQGLADEWELTSEGELDSDAVQTKWGAWFESLLAKLESDEFRKRLVCSVRYTKMPNIWEDPETASVFEESLFESLTYELMKKNSQNVLARRFKENVWIQSEYSIVLPGNISSALKEYLQGDTALGQSPFAVSM